MPGKIIALSPLETGVNLSLLAAPPPNKNVDPPTKHGQHEWGFDKDLCICPSDTSGGAQRRQVSVGLFHYILCIYIWMGLYGFIKPVHIVNFMV